MDTAKFMQSSGLQAAGYSYVTLGGIGYANGSNSGRNYIRAELLAGSELLAAYARTAAGSKIAKYCH